MPLDTSVVDYLKTDATLTGLLTGGIYAESAIGGTEGYSRDEDSLTKTAFDAAGFLLPTVMVRTAGKVPFGDIRDSQAKKVSASQRLELYFYQDRGHTTIDSAKERAFGLLEGKAFTGTYRLRWTGDTDPVPDVGPLSGNTTIRQTYQVISIRGN